MFKLTRIYGRHPVTHDETVSAARQSLLLGDNRTERKNSYPRLRMVRPEQEASADLYPTTGRNVIALPQRPAPPESAA